MPTRNVALVGTLLVLSTSLLVQACTNREVVAVVIGEVTISPPTARVNEGDSLVFSATLRDDSGNTLPSADRVEWLSDDPVRASVNSDGVVRGLRRGEVTIRATFRGVTGTATVTVVGTDGIAVSPPSGPTTEAGGQATFTVVLESAPTADVTIAVSSSDPDEGTVSAGSLTFTTLNWNAPQTVTVTGVDDALADGNVVYSIVTAAATSTDPNYDGLDAPDVSVTNIDDETAGITVSPPSGPTTESGGQATFTVVLNSLPSADVTIGLTSSNVDEGTVSPAALTFTDVNWNAAQTVTVTGVDDTLADGNVVYSIVTAAATSADPDYDGLDAVDASITNTDNETAGITISPPSEPTTESGGQATFTVVLNSLPSADVTMALSSSDSTEGSVSPTSLTFTDVNWNAPQSVTATGIDDSIADGNVVYSIVTAAVTSTDPDYDGLDAPDVAITNTDNETAGITLSPPSGPTTEAGGQATITVVLNSEPSADVAIGLSSSDATEGSVSPTALTFTTVNWNATQTVTVTGVDDVIADGNVVYSIVTAAVTSADPNYDGFDAPDVSVTNTDNETAGITVSAPSGPTTETGGQATLTVTLNSQPSSDVTIGLTSTDVTEGTVSPTSLTFTSLNWNAAQSVTVTGVDDAIADGNVVYSIVTAGATSTDASYAGLDAPDASVTNTDNETAGITLSPPSGPTTEAGGAATFTIVLNSQPTANVTIGLTSNDVAEGTVSPASLTFTTGNWNAPQTVTATGVDDAIADGNMVYSVVTAPATSTDASYDGLDATDVAITNTDNEAAGITVSPPSGPTTEAGGQATFTVVLNSEPTADVTIGLMSSAATEGTVSPTSLTFTTANWNATRTVTVTGVDDVIADGNVVYSIVTAAATSTDAGYNGLNATDVSITNNDNETAGITVSPPSGPTTEAGGQATFTVVLNSQPTANVAIALSSSDATEGTVSPTSLTFTAVNWNAPQTVTVTGVDDALADGNIGYGIVTAAATSTDPTYTGLDAADVAITNTDNETAGITVSPPSGPTTEAGAQATFTVVLNSQPTANVTIGVSSSDVTEGSVSPTLFTFTTANWNAAQTVTVMGVDDALADGNVVYSIVTAAATSTDASYNGLDAADVAITNTDNETAGITVSPPSGPTTEAGGQATFTVVLNSEPTANVTIGFASSDATEGTVSPTSSTFTMANWNAPQTVTLTGVDDAIADGNVVYSIVTAAAASTDPSYTGINAADVSVTNTDNEAAGITVSPPSGPTTEAGGQATFTVVLNSQPTANVTIGLTSSDATEGTVSPAALAFTATNWNAAQTVTVTGVDDALADGNVVYSIVTAAATSTDASYNGLDAADVAITNTDNEAAGITVSPPSGPTTEAGGAATFTIVLNSQPTANVTIGLTSNDIAEGTVSPASLTFTTGNWNAPQTVTATGVDDAIADGNMVYAIVTAAATSTDASYDGLDAADVAITNTDNETAGITVSPPSGPTTEAGGQATFTVVLNSEPSTNVTIGLASSDATEGTVSPAALAFTTANWNAAQTVTVTGVDDALADGNVIYSIVTAAATSTDPSYTGLDAPDVAITNNDNETAGITVSPPSGPTTEAGGQATFTVVLNSEPSANVAIGLASSDASEGTVSPPALTFTTANWNAAQTVTVTGVDDALADGSVVYSIVTAAATSTDPTYAGLDAADVAITNTDNETAGITVSPPSGPTTEVGGQATFTVVLNSQPTANVTIGLTSSDASEGAVSPASLTFTTANWNATRTVTATGVDDALADGDVVYSIVTAAATSTDANYNGLNAVDVSITNTDNETAGITVSPPSGPTTEAGGQATFTVVLNSQPTANVTIRLTSNDATEGTVSPTSLTFTTVNWNAAQTVTATGVDDALADGNIVYSIVTAAATSTDANYTGLNAPDVSITNNDNEAAGITVSPPSEPTTEAGGQATFTVVLNSQPAANVTIGLTSSDATEGAVSPTSLTFTTVNWNAAQTVTVTGIDDAIADGNVVYSVVTAPAASTDPNYDGLNTADVAITNTDNETAGITVSPPSGPTTEAGGQATFTIVLNSQPSANVTIGLTSSDATEGTVSPSALMFTAVNWNAPQTVTVTGVDDALADGNVVYSIVTAAAASTDPGYDGLNTADVAMTNTDNETAGITVSPPSGPTTEAGGQANFTVVLNSQPTASVTIGLTSGDTSEGTISPTALTFTGVNWNAPQTVTVTGVDDALADGNVVYTIVSAAATSTDPNYNGLNAADVSVTNTDNEASGVTVSAPSGPTTEAGGQATFTVVLNSQPTANVTIGLTSSDATEGTVSPASLTFTTANWNVARTVTVAGVDDALADGDVVYSIVTAAATSTDTGYDGLDAADVSITNTDNETAGITISPPSGPTTEAGGQATFTVVLNSQPTANVTIGLSSNDVAEGTVSPASLTFTTGNWNAPQTVTATGVDDAIADGNMVYSIVTAAATSTDPNYNGLNAPDVSITNNDNETAGITVSPPSGPTTEAGGQATFTVVLNSQPTANVTIGLSSSDVTEGTVSPTSLTFTSANWNGAQTVTVTGIDDAIADGNVVYSIVTGAATSTDPGYTGLDAADASVTNIDNEAAGITVSPPSGPTTEDGGQATFTVVLNSLPSADVTIGLTSNDATEGTVSPTALTFTGVNWNAPQTVTVTGVDDPIADGNVAYAIVTAPATSTDPGYNGLNAPDVAITNVDNNEVAGITISPASGPTTEAGGQGTFTVVLASLPSADVTIGLTSSDATEGTVSPASLTFTTANWNAAQTVTVTGVDDALADGNIVYTIVTAAATSTDPGYNGLDAADVTFTNVDNETAGITVSPPSGPTTEAGGQATFTVVLNSQPTANVTIGLTSSDATEGSVSPASLTFTTANWDATQTVTVTGIDDALADGNIVYSIVTAAATSTDAGYNGLNAADATLTNVDNETVGIMVSPASGPTTEAGGQATFTVVLNSQPLANVTIGLTSSDATEGTMAPASLTFTTGNWDAAQTVTVTGVDDPIADGNVVYSIVTAAATSTDVNYGGLNAPDVAITNVDDDGDPGITVSPASGPTTEGGGQATFTLVLNSQPTAGVTIGLTSSDATEGSVSPTSLTFTTANWNTAQTVTVMGVDDAIADGNIVYSIVTAAATSTDPDYSGLNAADVTFTNVDNETAGVTVSPPSGPTTEAGGQATFTVVLNSQPSASVAIGLTSSDVTEGTVSPASLTFTTVNWNAAQTVTVTGVEDVIADGNVVYSILTAAATSTDASYDGLNAADVSITNIDNETAGITVSPPSGPTTEAGGQATFTVILDSQPSANVTIGLSSSDATEGSVSPTTLTFTTANWNAAQTATVTGVDDTLADGNVMYSIVTAAATSTDPNYGGLNPVDVSITNVDDDAAGITVSPLGGTTTEAGGQATFIVVLNSQPTANVTIGLTSSDTGEGTVSPTLLTFTTANWNAAQTVTVTGQDDQVDDGDVAYTVVTAPAGSTDPNYGGVNAADVAITNLNDDFAFIDMTPGGGLVTTEAGGQATLTVVLTSQPTASVTMGVTSSDPSEGTVSPTSLTFTTGNWDAPQTVTVTGVDDAIADGTVFYLVDTAPATSADPNYNGLTAAASVENSDDDTAGFTIVESGGTTVVTEGGTPPPPPPTTDAFTVVLTSQPLTNVVLQVVSSRTTEATVTPATLTFTPTGGAAWDVPQTVTVTAVSDGTDDGDQLTNVTVSVVDGSSDDAFDNVPDQIVVVTTIDIDP